MKNILKVGKTLVHVAVLILNRDKNKKVFQGHETDKKEVIRKGVN